MSLLDQRTVELMKLDASQNHGVELTDEYAQSLVDFVNSYDEAFNIHNKVDRDVWRILFRLYNELGTQEVAAFVWHGEEASLRRFIEMFPRPDWMDDDTP